VVIELTPATVWLGGGMRNGLLARETQMPSTKTWTSQR